MQKERSGNLYKQTLSGTVLSGLPIFLPDVLDHTFNHPQSTYCLQLISIVVIVHHIWKGPGGGRLAHKMQYLLLFIHLQGCFWKGYSGDWNDIDDCNVKSIGVINDAIAP